MSHRPIGYTDERVAVEYLNAHGDARVVREFTDMYVAKLFYARMAHALRAPRVIRPNTTQGT